MPDLKLSALAKLDALGILDDNDKAQLAIRREAELAKKAKELFRGSSDYANNLRELIVKIAVLNTGSVLIAGESGTGKDVVARIIALAQAGYAYVPVNCAAIPDTLFESEFFGHLAGAFTGASRERKGHFETASNGLIFLDEVGEMPMHQQAKLLRVLQDRTFTPVGASEPRLTSARVVAATNKPIDRASNFIRLDFFERVSEYEITLEPLRNHPQDLFDLTSQEFFDYAMECRAELKNFPFDRIFLPGNARQALRLFKRFQTLGKKYVTTMDFN